MSILLRFWPQLAIGFVSFALGLAAANNHAQGRYQGLRADIEKIRRQAAEEKTSTVASALAHQNAQIQKNRELLRERDLFKSENDRLVAAARVVPVRLRIPKCPSSDLSAHDRAGVDSGASGDAGRSVAIDAEPFITFGGRAREMKAQLQRCQEFARSLQ